MKIQIRDKKVIINKAKNNDLCQRNHVLILEVRKSSVTANIIFIQLAWSFKKLMLF